MVIKDSDLPTEYASVKEVLEAEDRWWRRERPEEEWKYFEDFRYFLYEVWTRLKLPKPTEMQEDMAVWLQRGPRRRITKAFRGIGKSWETSAYANWRLMRNPQLKLMVVSASKQRADQFSTFTLLLLDEIPMLRFLKPKKNQRSSKIEFDVGPARPDHSPSVKSVGIMGQLTGSRADEIIADDIEVPNNSETQGMRDKLAERIKEFDAVVKPGGVITFLGTPQCEDSVYSVLEEERGYTARVWPARYPSMAKITAAYANSIAPIILKKLEEHGDKIVGMTTDPKRFSDTDLMQREASYGRSGFLLQFMLDTSLSDADRYPLKLSDLVVMDLDLEMGPEKIIYSKDPRYCLQDIECVGLKGDRYYSPAATMGSYIEYTGSVMFVDPAGRGKDETSYAIVKMLNGYLFVLDVGGLQGGYDEVVMLTITNLAKKHKVNLIKIEDNFGDGMFNKLLEPYLRKHYPVSIEGVRHNRQKELRIVDTLEPIMNQHRLIIDRNLILKDRESTKDYPEEKRLKYQLFYQMSRITKDRGALAHDDRLEALAGAVNYWVEQMGQDEDTKIEQRKEKLLQYELEHMLGLPGLSIEGLAMGMSVEMAREAALRKAASIYNSGKSGVIRTFLDGG